MRRSHTTGSLLLTLSLFVWAGMVAGISFLEAPLKFTAPHITVALGLGIGRIVFAALNKAELTLGTIALISAFYLRVPVRVGVGLVVLSVILLAQTFWLLPALDVRATVVLAGHTPPPSSLHTLYIVLEVVKLLALLGTASWAHGWALHVARQRTAVAEPRSYHTA